MERPTLDRQQPALILAYARACFTFACCSAVIAFSFPRTAAAIGSVPGTPAPPTPDCTGDTVAELRPAPQASSSSRRSGSPGRGAQTLPAPPPARSRAREATRSDGTDLRANHGPRVITTVVWAALDPAEGVAPAPIADREDDRHCDPGKRDHEHRGNADEQPDRSRPLARDDGLPGGAG